MSPPGGSSADPQQAQPEQGADGTESPGELYSGGSCPRISRVMEVSDLTAFCLWFSLHIPSSTLCQCRDTRIPLQPANHPHSQDRNQHRWCMDSPRFMVKLELLLTGISGLGDLAHGEGAAQGRVCSWSSGSSCPDAGPWLLFHWKGRDNDPFLAKHLSDVSWAS